MQSRIRIIPEEEYLQVAQINYNAYPYRVLTLEERKQRAYNHLFQPRNSEYPAR